MIWKTFGMDYRRKPWTDSITVSFKYDQARTTMEQFLAYDEMFYSKLMQINYSRNLRKEKEEKFLKPCGYSPYINGTDTKSFLETTSIARESLENRFYAMARPHFLGKHTGWAFCVFAAMPIE